MNDETLYFKSGKDYVKAEWNYDDYAESPRTDRDNLGKMVFFKNKNGKFGDEQVSEWREFFIDQLTDSNPMSHYEGVLKEDFGITRESCSMDWRLESSLDGLTESELYDKWVESKAAVIPIDVYIHSGTTCHEAPVRKSPFQNDLTDGGYIHNDGFAYVDKDNEEYRQELESGKTEEEAKKWAEQNLRGEIKDYDSYLEGDIHTLTVSYFNPKTNEWEKSDMESGILGGTLEQALKDRGTSIDEILAKNTVFNLENSVNQEFKSETVRMYIEDVKKNLPDFDNSLKAAATSVSKQWKAKAETNREETDRLNRWELRKKALKEYFKENGINSADKMFAFLAKETGFKKKSQSLPPLSIQDKSLVAYFAKINNPARSDNGGLAKLLLVDEKNKSLAYFDSPSYIITKGDIWGKTVNLGSGKQVAEKAKELLRYGFKDVDVADKFLVEHQKHFTKQDLEKSFGRDER